MKFLVVQHLELGASLSQFSDICLRKATESKSEYELNMISHTL